ncbi:Uncharacterised protein [Staphylococcus aureus]|uniref:Uncharacterized protein n=1 Tax=Staphylococcus aureus TaxID=1280 RepID=A0A380DZW3_STAAU|nr:Uncharacterised protein [Staphylococcus aureus]
MNSIIFNTSELHVEISFDVFLYFKNREAICRYIYNFKEEFFRNSDI